MTMPEVILATHLAVLRMFAFPLLEKMDLKHMAESLDFEFRNRGYGLIMIEEKGVVFASISLSYEEPKEEYRKLKDGRYLELTGEKLPVKRYRKSKRLLKLLANKMDGRLISWL